MIFWQTAIFWLGLFLRKLFSSFAIMPLLNIAQKNIRRGFLREHQQVFNTTKNQFPQYLLYSTNGQNTFCTKVQNEHRLPRPTPPAGNRLFSNKSTPTPSLCWLILFCWIWRDQVGQIWIICMLLTESAADPLGCLSFTLTDYINEDCKSLFSKEIYTTKTTQSF